MYNISATGIKVLKVSETKDPEICINCESFSIREVADSWIYGYEMWQRLPNSTNEREVEPT